MGNYQWPRKQLYNDSSTTDCPDDPERFDLFSGKLPKELYLFDPPDDPMIQHSALIDKFEKKMNFAEDEFPVRS